MKLLEDVQYSGLSSPVTVTYMDGSSESHSFMPVDLVPHFDPTDYNSWQEGEETEVDYLEIGGATLKKQASTYQQRACAVSSDLSCWFVPSGGTPSSSSSYPPHDPEISQSQTWMGGYANGSFDVSEADFAYDQYCNLNDKKEYDVVNVASGNAYNQGDLIRETAISYVGTTPYVSAHLVDLPTSIQITNGTAPFAETLITYDQYPLASASGAFQHNDSAFGSGFLTRGNPTNITKYVDSSPPDALTTQVYFDILGNPVEIIDQRGVQGDFWYTDSPANQNGGGSSYAFPTSFVEYTGLNGSGTAFTASRSYDYRIGKVLTDSDINNCTTSVSYLTVGNAPEPLERPVSVSRCDGGTSIFSYTDTPGNFSVTSMVDQLTTNDHALISSQYYDGLGRKSSTVLQEGAGHLVTTSFAYDQRSREYQVSNPYRSSVTGYTTKAFDGINRVTSITAPDGSSKTTMKYAGTLVLAADAQNINRQTKTDGAGRLIQVVENQSSFNGSGVTQASGCPNGVSCTYTTNYQYDPLDDLISVNQQDPNTGTRENRTFSYDWLRRLTAATNPETGTMAYQYDQSNNVSQKTDNRGTTTTFSAYDGLNRPVQKTYTDGTPTVHYCYDGQLYTSGSCTSSSVTGQKLGHLTYIGNSNSSTAFTNFLNRGLIGATVQTTSLPSFTLAPLTFSYTYTLTGNLSSETYPSGKKINTSYDSADRIEKVGFTLPQTFSYAALNPDPTQAYTPDGQIQNFTYGSGVTEQRSYDAQMLLPTGVTVQNSAGALLNLGFGYSPAGSNNGNLMRQTIGASSGLTQALTQNYSYDPENRIGAIAEAPGGSINQGFIYDAFGNMALTSGALNTQPGHTPTAAGATTLPFNAFNQWTLACTTPPCYDAAGNQTAVAGDVYSFDGENRMTAANVMATGDTTYGYDGAGQRVWKTNILGATVYAYDAAGELAAEYSTIAPQSSGTEYLSTDQLGSTRMISDASGNNVLSRYDYVPFGQEIPSGMDGRGTGYGTGVYPSSPDVQDKKFTGKERDAETGLDYFGARFYGSALGRFTSPDPLPWLQWQRGSSDQQNLLRQLLINPQNLNMYAYVDNNPLSKSDPTGMSQLIFDAKSQTITMMSDDTCTFYGQWKAANKVAVHAPRGEEGGEYTHGPIQDGKYDIEKRDQNGATTHLGGDKNSAYGENGIIHIKDANSASGETVQGDGVHSGRADRQGPESLTAGCIRTTDEATKAINKAAKTDAVTSITVKNNGTNVSDWQAAKAAAEKQEHPHLGQPE